MGHGGKDIKGTPSATLVLKDDGLGKDEAEKRSRQSLQKT